MLGYFLFTGVFDMIFGKNEEAPYYQSNPTKIIDKSVHHHYHDNRKINVDGKEFKSMIGDEDGQENYQKEG
ncbi:hypothetical protein [Flagellimonas marina]|uniref:Uncharacterized protein n=1 Tax=Flagellimonas marina TaxID=1775168 RepID=A0ABV8PH99_9FLAO